MESINIEAITGKKMGTATGLSVQSLTSTKPTDNNVEKIIESREKRRVKLAEFMEAQYDLCSQKIHFANHLLKTDLLFSVPGYDNDLPAYSPLECLVYLEKRLRSSCYDTHIINKTTIFITWLYIEVNMKEKRSPDTTTDKKANY